MNFGESMLDKLAVWQGDISLDALEFHNHEVFANLVRQGKGCVMVGSHLGNLEICRALDFLLAVLHWRVWRGMAEKRDGLT